TEHENFSEVESDVKARIDKLMRINGTESPRSFHKRLGHIMWEQCGMARSKEGLEKAIRDVQALRKEFWENVRVVGNADALNPELERAGRVADFLEFGELMCRDALMREESCGGHFRIEHQTDEGEAKRDDDAFAFVGVWEYIGNNIEPVLHKEALIYDNVKLATRSYK
ncbi:MAG: fumarate reductase/succinate dehydrogenase flavoprotein subunit, partial [Verrucomicrobiota bacterium]|nr:fumarate reductase/succinate dehydrogenase flavoprotein subunit [Verrucomicrobiota bacterium]